MAAGCACPPKPLEYRILFNFLVRRVLPARLAILADLHPVGMELLVFRRGIISIFTDGAFERYDFTHRSKPLNV